MVCGGGYVVVSGFGCVCEVDIIWAIKLKKRG